MYLLKEEDELTEPSSVIVLAVVNIEVVLGLLLVIMTFVLFDISIFHGSQLHTTTCTTFLHPVCQSDAPFV